MITGPIIAEIAALVGDPARATMVSALLDGRALTASELAFAARITPQTASTHLAKLTEAGVLSVVRSGRHRYFRLASPDGGRHDRRDRRRRSREETAIPPALPSSPRAQCGPNLLRPPCGPPQRRSHRFVRRPRIHRARRRRRRDHDRRHPFSHRVRDRASRPPFEPPPLLPALPRLDRATPTHRGCGRGRDHQALLRSRLDGTDDAQPRGDRHPVGTAGLPEDLRHRRVRDP